MKNLSAGARARPDGGHVGMAGALLMGAASATAPIVRHRSKGRRRPSAVKAAAVLACLVMAALGMARPAAATTAGNGTGLPVHTVQGVAFSDPQHGWLLGSPSSGVPAAMVTGDGGTTWTPSALPGGLSAALGQRMAVIPGDNNDAFFCSSQMGGIDDMLVSTSNAGSTWSVTPAPDGCTDVVAASATNLWAWGSAPESVVDPTTGQTETVTIPVAVHGVYVNDAGWTWSADPMSTNASMTSVLPVDIAVNPAGTGILLLGWFDDYIGGYGGNTFNVAYSSNDGGGTWVVHSPLGLNARYEIESPQVLADGTEMYLASSEGPFPTVEVSTDGGQTFNAMNMPAGSNDGTDAFNTMNEGMSFSDASHGFVAGWDDLQRPLVEYTADGGVSWSSVQLPGNSSLHPVATSTTTAVIVASDACGSNPQVFSLSAGNGGLSAQSLYSAGRPVGGLYALSAYSDNQAIAGAGCAGDLTSDGTPAGTTVHPPSVLTYSDAFAWTGPSDVWAAGSVETEQDSQAFAVSPTISHSADGGSTWTTRQLPQEAALDSIAFPDSQHGWAVGSYSDGGYYNAALSTSDGGSTWNSFNPAGTWSQFNPVAVAFADSNHGVVIDSGGSDLSYTNDAGKTWTAASHLATNNGYTYMASNLPAGFVSHASSLMAAPSGPFFLAGSIYSGGSSGALAESTDGLNWNSISGPIGSTSLQLVSFDSPTDGYVVGTQAAGGNPSPGNQVVWHTANGGQTWSAPSDLPPGTQYVRALSASIGAIWVTASDSMEPSADRLLRSTNGGQTWTQLSGPPPTPVVSMPFSTWTISGDAPGPITGSMTITNHGDGPLSITNTASQGSAQPQLGGTCISQQTVPGSTCQLTATVANAPEGLSDALLTLYDNAASTSSSAVGAGIQQITLNVDSYGTNGRGSSATTKWPISQGISQMAPGPDGTLWEISAGEIYHVTNGSLTAYPINATPSAITTGPGGHLWYTGSRYDSATSSTVVGAGWLDVSTPQNVHFYDAPAGISLSYTPVLGPDERLWSVGSYTYSDSSGTYHDDPVLAAVDGQGIWSYYDLNSDLPAGAVEWDFTAPVVDGSQVVTQMSWTNTDSSGNYTTNQWGLLRFTPGPSPSATLQIASGDTGYLAPVAMPDGSLWTTGYDTANSSEALYHFGSSGVPATFDIPASITLGQFFLGPDGGLWYYGSYRDWANRDLPDTLGRIDVSTSTPSFLLWEDPSAGTGHQMVSLPDGTLWTNAGGLTQIDVGNGLEPVQTIVDTPSIGLTSENNPLTYNANYESVTFMATVNSPGGTAPTGSVAFYVDGSKIGTATLDYTGTAAYTDTTIRRAGHYTVTAVYSGDSLYSSVTSAPLTEIVQPLSPMAPSNVTATPSTTSIQVSFTPSSADTGGAVTYTATAHNGPTTISSPAGSSSPLSISGLAPHTLYEIQVVASNSAGTASSFPLNTATLPTGLTRASTSTYQATSTSSTGQSVSAVMGGLGSVTAGWYPGLPPGAPAYPKGLSYFDVYLVPAWGSTYPTQTPIIVCGAPAGASLEWLNSNSFQPVRATINKYGTNCESFTLSSTTSPTPNQLVGTVFALADLTAPGVSVTAPASTTSLATTFTVAWKGSDTGGSGLAYYSLRYRKAAWNQNLPSTYSNWISSTTGTSHAFTGSPGYLYCFSVQAHDHAGNASPWSGDKCTALPVDDTALATSGTWTRGTAVGYYLNTYTSSTGHGTYLYKSGALAGRVALVATKCSACGTIVVYYGSTAAASVNLYSAATTTRVLIALPHFSSGTIKLLVTSTGKKVIIDGLLLSRI